MKNLGGKLFYFFSLFLPKVGGEVYQSWGGGEVYQSWGEVYCNIMFLIGEPHRRKVFFFGGGASNAIVMNNEKYTRSVSLRNLCDYPPPPGRQYKREGKVH